MNNFEHVPLQNTPQTMQETIPERELSAIENEQLPEQDNNEVGKIDNLEEPPNKETLTIRQEEIRLKIIEIEEKKKKKISAIKKFITDAESIINMVKNPAEQMKLFLSGNLFDSLPEKTVTLIQEHYKKYNFIDFKAAELDLEDDVLKSELEDLQSKSNALEDQMEALEHQENQGFESTQSDNETIEEDMLNLADDDESLEAMDSDSMDGVIAMDTSEQMSDVTETMDDHKLAA